MKRRQALSLAMNMGWTMLFSLLIPLFAGIWLDKTLGTAPLFILIGAVLGISAATIGVARMTIRTFAKTTRAFDAVKEVVPPEDDPTVSDMEFGWDQHEEANDKEGPA